MTAREIQRALMAPRYRRSFCLPNYTPSGWFECDVFELTKAGFMREYEIKLSVSDFLADAKKARELWEAGKGLTLGETKHSLLARACVKGPSRFYFVAPEGLLRLEQIPAWAGFITAARRDPPYQNDGLFLKTVREAPQLHRSKSLPEVRRLAEGVCYWRYNNLFIFDGRQPVEQAA